jgi:CrcB protein
MKLWFWIGGFALVGIFSRYFIDQYFYSDGRNFPLSTFLINMLGSFLIGVVYVLSANGGYLGRDLSVALMVGLLGGFTTFSAFSLQSFLLFEKGQTLIAAAYFIGSPVLGLIMAGAGLFVTKLLVDR